MTTTTEYPKLKPEVKSRWLTALRSGDYPQGRSRLVSVKNGVRSYCCLGVLCEVMDEPFFDEDDRENGYFHFRDFELMFLWKMEFSKTIFENWESYPADNNGEIAGVEDAGWRFNQDWFESPCFTLNDVWAVIPEALESAGYERNTVVDTDGLLVSLADLNDSQVPFVDIATVIEAYL